MAESLFLDDISTGASNDIQRATAMARKMVTSYGMSEKLGAVSFDWGPRWPDSGASPRGPPRGRP